MSSGEGSPMDTSPASTPDPAPARFRNRVLVLTGAAGDLGRATARRFAREGAHVVAIDLPDRPLDETVTALESEGAEALALAADVTEREQLASAFDRAVERFGGFDFLFNNAGISGRPGNIEHCDEADFDAVMRTNVKGVFLGMQLGIPHLRRRGAGVIVNCSSIAGKIGNPWLPQYSASKHAVIGLTRSVASSHGPEGIRVVAICPGPIEGRMMRYAEQVLTPDDPEVAKKGMTTLIPQGRYGSPDEVAALVAFVCSDDASYLDGTAVVLDGGMVATVG